MGRPGFKMAGALGIGVIFAPSKACKEEGDQTPTTLSKSALVALSPLLRFHSPFCSCFLTFFFFFSLLWPFGFNFQVTSRILLPSVAKHLLQLLEIRLTRCGSTENLLSHLSEHSREPHSLCFSAHFIALLICISL